MSISWKTEWWFLLLGYQPHAGAAAALPPTLPNGYWIGKISATFKSCGKAQLMKTFQTLLHSAVGEIFIPHYGDIVSLSPWGTRSPVSLWHPRPLLVTFHHVYLSLSASLNVENQPTYIPFSMWKHPEHSVIFLSHECVYINVFCIQQLLNFGICCTVMVLSSI